MDRHLSEDQLVHYTYHTLTDAQQETMDVHVAACQDCRARLAGHQALQRRIHYSILEQRRQASAATQANFAAIAPRLRRARRSARFWAASRQFVYGAAALAVVLALGIGLALSLAGIQPPVPGPRPQPLPPGTYTTTITDGDIPISDQLGPAERSSLEGDWELELAEGNRYVVTLGGTITAEEGHYALTPDQIVFTAEKDGCKEYPGQEVGTYQWASDGESLTLTRVEDECLWRQLAFTLRPWARSDSARPGAVLPLGFYTKTITLEDTAADEQMRNYADRDYFAAQQELVLGEGNRYSMITTWGGQQVGVFQEGSYSVRGDTIIFTAQQEHCAGSDGEVGTYRWAFDGQDLTLQALEDRCHTREFLHTVRPWSRADYERPLGTYGVTIAEADIPPSVRDDLRPGLPGRWELTLDQESRFSVAHDGATVSRGHYLMAQGVLQLAAAQGECTGVGEIGNYQWALDGNTLTLTATPDWDWCDQRNAVFSLRPLARLDLPQALAEPGEAAGPPLGIPREDLAGLWGDPQSGMLLQFNPDGTFGLAYSTDWLAAAPLDSGQYWLEGSLLTFISDLNGQWCVQQEGSYRVELTQLGRLRFELQEDPCQIRATTLLEGIWSPTER